MSEGFQPQCPVPISDYQNVLLAHGGGGRLMHQLIDRVFVRAFSNPVLESRHDSAVVPLGESRMAFTTDSYVVKPLVFAGGDIGSMAIHGTVNDLAMSGARPLYISSAFIIEEGLPMETLQHIVNSMRKAADECGVQIVTGDTKVVDRGKGDGVFINTAGVGIIEHQLAIHPWSIRQGDVIIVNGDLGRHGIAIMAAREGLEFETAIESDSAPLADLVLEIINSGIAVHCLRDLTRGGLATTLNELAEAADVNIEIRETDIPVREDVRGACEILGFDPLYVANEGRMACFVPESDVERTLSIMRGHKQGAGAAAIGIVKQVPKKIVTLENVVGSRRILDMLSGEQLPRIC